MAWKAHSLVLWAVVLVVALAREAVALCPYHMLWMPGSPLKLPDDHPALQGVAEHHQARQVLSMAMEGDLGGIASPTGFLVGAGSCSYTNPITQQETCVQFVGKAWTDAPTDAEALCVVQGLMPGAFDSVFDPETLCAEFSDENFAGVCINEKGSSEERRTAFVSQPGEVSSSCEQLQAVCETFGGGVFDGEGGKCAQDSKAEPPLNTSAACQLSPGISGGGHMHIDSFWDETCENQGNQYSQPLRWAADTETVLIQRGGRTRGRVYYDLKTNRKRSDWTSLDDFVFFGIRKATVVHEHGVLYEINWDTGVCTKTRLPVGNLRANWVLDNLGAGTTSQYMGSAYIVYDGEYRHVKQWRKTEPLENAFMIQSFDEEGIWETPEGPKRRVLVRETPGAPGQGDSIDIFYNHTTDFDDSVFDVFKDFNCTSPEESSADGNGITSGLNLNSSLSVDSSIVRVECKECNLTYSDIKPSGKGDDTASGKANTTYFNGTEVIREEAYLELSWEYFPDSDTFSFVLKSEMPGVWLGISFPTFKCAMVPAEGVIGIPNEGGSGSDVGAFKFEIADLSGVVLDNGQSLEDAAFSDIDGMRTLSFTRKADNGGEIVLDATGPIDVNWATGLEGVLGYHGVDGRGCLTINAGTV